MSFFHTEITYESLAAMLAATRGPGRDTARKLAHNTYAERRGPGAIAIRFHATDILTFHDDGRVVFDCQGWRSVTTKARLNDYGPLRVWSDRGVWYAGGPAHTGDGPVIYADGMTFHTTTGAITGDAPRSALDDARAMARRIRVYVRAMPTGDALAEILANTGGDCWYCLMETAEGQSLGDATGDASHLTEHMREGYYVGTMIIRAVREAGYGPFMVTHGGPDTLRRCLTRYLKARLTTTTGARPMTAAHTRHDARWTA
jgi:hypothetical protein